jgi:hypothetical protein
MGLSGDSFMKTSEEVKHEIEKLIVDGEKNTKFDRG